ncbi:flagellar basal-body MS-ring/collar protein FliF [Paenibacillus sp. LHD-38]|uniref:flagellar basal-body MS-ring/collar protein FliF n=1 Tax=Paenibacillus sp. LHD-38 TaxID=3072143 RepID=UPI00280F1940|nr:flagellar basal-body MS-ring/collar protein FliF [Paenibacillus sp. LHD-38]MDQ8733363.1 flagellar basal-body MS-ring/collar protein FliF [Paenibacillus sp. LHD-38]
MNERIAQFRSRLTQFWGQMGRKQKIWLGASISGLLLTIILLTIVFTRTEYEIAFQNLDTTDAAAIMTYLDGSGIPYELSNNGKSISVPSTEAARIKVDVGSQGLVQNGSIGFEAFNSSSSQFGTTENEFNVKYLNALNGEIQQLLNAMQGVDSSKVLVNLPEESVFLSPEDAEQASASIMMRFMSGYRPSQKEIDGYYNLVKTAVPNLAMKDITISSPQGELTFSETDGGIANNSDAVESQFLIQRKYETELKKNIQQFLGPIVGVDNLVIQVSSSMNFDKKTSQESLVKPLDNNNNNGIIISEEINNSTSTGSSGEAGGVAGTGETDVPGYETATTGESSSETSSQIRNYDVSRISSNIVSGPFVLKDLSISIGIEESEIQDEASKTAIMTYLTALVRAQLADSGQDVTNDELMAKKVALIASTFSGSSSDNQSSVLSTPWLIGIGVAALAIIGGLIVILTRRRKKAAEEEIELAAPAKVEYPTLDLESVNNDSQARKNLETLAKRKPDEFVNLLRTWLVDE